jgi:hypothetical protein
VWGDGGACARRGHHARAASARSSAMCLWASAVDRCREPSEFVSFSPQRHRGTESYQPDPLLSLVSGCLCASVVDLFSGSQDSSPAPCPGALPTMARARA